MSEKTPQELARAILAPLEHDDWQTRSQKSVEMVKASKVLAAALINLQEENLDLKYENEAYLNSSLYSVKSALVTHELLDKAKAEIERLRAGLLTVRMHLSIQHGSPPNFYSDNPAGLAFLKIDELLGLEWDDEQKPAENGVGGE